MSRKERIILGAVLFHGTVDVVDVAERAGIPVFDAGRAAYDLAHRDLAVVTETRFAAVRRVGPAPRLRDLPPAIRLRCIGDYVGAVYVTRQAVLA